MKFLYISTTVVETVPLLQQATTSMYLAHVDDFHCVSTEAYTCCMYIHVHTELCWNMSRLTIQIC